MSAANSSLLQTAIQNLQISQQAKDRDRDAASSVDFSSFRSDFLDLDSEDDGEGDEMVDVGQGTRPPTRPASPKPKRVASKQGSSRLLDSEDTIDPVSHHWRIRGYCADVIAHETTDCTRRPGTVITGHQIPCSLREGL